MASDFSSMKREIKRKESFLRNLSEKLAIGISSISTTYCTLQSPYLYELGFTFYVEDQKRK